MTILTTMVKPAKAISLTEHSSEHIWLDDDSMNVSKTECLVNSSLAVNNYFDGSVLEISADRQSKTIFFVASNYLNKVTIIGNDSSIFKKSFLSNHELNTEKKKLNIPYMSASLQADKTWFKFDFYSIFAFLILSGSLAFKK